MQSKRSSSASLNWVLTGPCTRESGRGGGEGKEGGTQKLHFCGHSYREAYLPPLPFSFLPGKEKIILHQHAICLPCLVALSSHHLSFLPHTVVLLQVVSRLSEKRDAPGRGQELDVGAHCTVRADDR